MLKITKNGVRIIGRHKKLVATIVIVAGVAYVLYRANNERKRIEEIEAKRLVQRVEYS